MSSDCETREIRTVYVDSIGQASHGNFTTFLNIPLRNVVSAELLTVNLNYSTSTGGSSNVVYVYCDQLVSKFNERTLPSLGENIGGYPKDSSGTNIAIATASPLVSNTAYLQGALLRMNTEQTPGLARSVYSQAGDYSSKVYFIDPIRQLDKLTIRLYGEDGTPVSPTLQGFFTFRFETVKNNICNY